MRSVTVIGSGAVGKFYGGLFVLSGCRVSYLEHSDFAIIQEKKYYEIELPDGRVIKIRPHQVENDFKRLPKADIILIALKTTENHLLTTFLPAVLKKESKILLLQNGLGNEEYLFTFIKNHPIVCGVVTIGVSKIKPAYVKVKHFGEIKLAPFSMLDNASCEDIKEQLLQANDSKFGAICPSIFLFENHRILRWTKLLWNASFSVLSLLFNVSVDILVTETNYQTIVRALMDEICLAAKEDGASIEDTIETIIEVTATQKGYYPSMYYDFKLARSIESQYILRNVLDYARVHHLNLPLLSLVYKKLMLQIKRKEWFSPAEQDSILSLLNSHLGRLH